MSVRWRADLERDVPTVAVAGGKALGLVRLGRAGVTVPDWFLLEPDLPLEAAQDQAVDAWRRAGWRRVAVRSSAVGEDGAQHSFAGLYQTILGVADEAALRAAVAACRASADTERVRAYLQAGRLPATPVAVVVQELVEGDASGVLFTRDPDWPEGSLLSASWGLGEGVVSGAVPADTWHVLADGEQVARIASKDRAVRLVDGVPAEVDVPAADRDRPCLDGAQVAALVALGRRVEAALGVPLDLEWTLRGGEPVLLQARPITLALPAGRRMLWDNSNIIESYYGPTSPLTYSFASRAYTQVYQLFCEVMGVAPDVVAANAGVFPRMIGLIRGRIYYNLDAWYTVVGLLPGYRWNRVFLEQMMGVTEVAAQAEPAAPPSQRERLLDLWRLTGLAGTMLRRVRGMDASVQAFTRRFEDAMARYRGPGAIPMSARDPVALVDAYTDLESRLLRAWSTPIVNDFMVMIFHGVLRSQCAKWLPDAAGLHNHLLAAEGGLMSTAPTEAALAIAARIRTNPALVDLVMAGDEARAWPTLLAAPGLGAELLAWVERYGDRCSDELKLEVPAIRQQPWRLVGVLRGYLQTPVVGGAAPNDEQRLRQEADSVVAQRLSGWRAKVFAAVLRHTRARVRDRENLRFLRTRIFGLVRDLFDALGAHMAAAGALVLPADVYFLTVDEALGWVRGTSPTLDLRGLVDLRKAEYRRFAALPAPADRFATWGPVWRDNRFSARPRARAAAGEGLSGLSACPGLVEALAAVVHDPQSHATTGLGGRILCAYRTDPGWVPLFPTASAILVERGSLLSHSAVVAREMGIPTIVGVAGLMERVRDGERLRLDCGAGAIEQLGSTP